MATSSITAGCACTSFASYCDMKESQIQILKMQLEEAVQMLRLVAKQQRTCMEVQEWLDSNHPYGADEDNQSKPIVDLLIKRGIKHG